MIRVLEVNVDDLYIGGVYTLVRSVIKNRTEGLKIDIGAIEKFKHKENIKSFNEDGSDIYWIGGEGNTLQKQISVYKKLKKLFLKAHYDCVHIHSDVSYKVIGAALAAKHSGVKKIIIHSHAAGVDGNHRKMKRIIHGLCRKPLKKMGTQFVACSYLAAQWMFPNIERGAITIINNGIDIEKFRYDPETRSKLRKELNINDNTTLLGHVGRFAYQKNHDFLVAIMDQIREKGLDMKLILIGEGPDEDRIKDMVRKMNLDEYIMFYGTSNRVNDLFQAMDIFLLPSHFEGLPIVGVEAQTAGLPVIFSDCITREAKLTDEVSFLPIDEESVEKWIGKIEELSAYERADTSETIKEKKFSLQDTIEEFLALYGDKDDLYSST